MNYKIPSICRFFPSAKGSYTHENYSKIFNFINQNRAKCRLIRCVRQNEDLVSQNFNKASERLFPKEEWTLFGANATLNMLLRQQFHQNLKFIDGHFEKKDVGHLSNSNSDIELFKIHGADLGAKSKIPDQGDFRILLYAKELAADGRKVYIISADGVFIKNKSLIESNYSAIVLPEDHL